jgi:hypothetical protein
VAVQHGVHQRRVAVAVPLIDRRAAVEQRVHGCRIVLQDRGEEGTLQRVEDLLVDRVRERGA